MPVTPLHIGPALVAKSLSRRYFSIPTFAFTQIAIDSEVLVGLAVVGDLSFHAVLHTFAGATGLTVLTVLLYRSVISRVARLWNFIANVEPDSLTYMAPVAPWSAVVLSAATGSYSHVLLDAIGNPEITPFAPFVGENPFYGLVLSQGAILLCLLCWALGGGAILAVTYRRRLKMNRHS